MTRYSPTTAPRHPGLRLAGLLAAISLVACATGRDKGRLVAVSGVSGAEVEGALAPKRVALVIGVGDYEDAFWPDLEWAEKDARDLAAALGDPQVGGFDAVKVVTGAGAREPAQVLAAVNALAGEAPGPKDTVVVYISAHGTLLPAPRGQHERVLVLENTRRDLLRETGLRVQALLGAVEALPSRRKAVVLATCHSGSGKSLLLPEVAARLEGMKGAPPLEAVSRGSLVLSAADFGQPAREDDRLENDVYTHFLIEALRAGADANGDGGVTATEAHDWARRRTYEFTEGHQVPSVEATIVGTDPVLLAGERKRPGLPVVYSYSPGLEGYDVELGGRLKGALPGQIVVEGGAQSVAITRGGETLWSGELELAPGDRISVDELLREAEPRWSARVTGGGLRLVSPALTDALAPNLGGIGVRLDRRDAPLTGLHLRLDLGAARAHQTVTPGVGPVSQDVSISGLGLGAYSDWSWGPLRVETGPHLWGFALIRSFPGRDVDTQSFMSILPGWTVGLGLEHRPVVLGLEVSAHYLPLVLNGQVQSVAVLGARASVGMSF